MTIGQSDICFRQPHLRSQQPVVSSGLKPSEFWRSDVEGLRGLAVLAILVYHALPSILPGGFVGVDIFFVVSGFVVGKVLIADLGAGRFTFGTFYARRVRRIVPALIVVLFATTVFARFLIGADDLQLLSQQVGAATIFVPNLLAWSQSGYFEYDAAYKPLIHLWSLGVEEQYYALLPAGFVLAWRKCPEHVFGIVLGVASISFLCCIAVTIADGNAAFYLPITRFWELLSGLLIAWRTIPSGGPPFGSDRAALLGAALLVGSFLFFRESQSFPGWQAAVPVAGTLLLIAGGSGSFVSRLFLSKRPLTFLGEISYAAYLWHWPMLVLGRFWYGGDLTIIQSTTTTLCSLLVAWISTRFIEAPFRVGAWSRQELLPKLLMAALLLVGALTIIGSAFGPKVVSSPALQRLEAYPQTQGDIWREDKDCFIGLNEEKDFGSICLGEGDIRKPLVAVWGDSLAAHLWPGLDDAARIRNWRLAQLTVSQCPPIISGGNEGNNKCANMRTLALGAISKIQPSTLVLAGGWTRYKEDTLVEMLGPTIKTFKDAGISRVLVVGPVPIWKPTLAKALASDMRKFRLDDAPLYTATGFLTEVHALDEKLRNVTERAGGVYLSTLSILCKEPKKCKVWVDEDRKSILTTYDSGHFSIEHSRWFGGKISGVLFDR